MESESLKNNRVHRYGFSFSKSHAASSLSMLSNSSTLRDNNANKDVIFNSVISGKTQKNENIGISSTMSSSSSSTPSEMNSKISKYSNNDSNINNSDNSNFKNNIINIFSLKSKSNVNFSNNIIDMNNNNNNNIIINNINNNNINDNNSTNNNTNININNNPKDKTFSNGYYTQNFNPQQIAEPGSTSKSLNIILKNENKETSNPNIFKKIISRKALIPRMKAFKRIANDMEIESFPLDDEMNHELMITTAMKEEDEILNSKSSYSSLLSINNNSRHLLNHDNLKKFEIINKANESWSLNRRKSSSSLTNSESYRSHSRRESISTNVNFNNSNKIRRASVSSLTPTNTNISGATTTTTSNINLINSNKNSKDDLDNFSTRSKSETKNSLNNPLLLNPFETIRKPRKRKLGNYDDCSTDVEEYFSDDGGTSVWNPLINCKRRLVSGSVSNSPKSPALDPFPSRRNSMMMQSMQSASDDFEQMSLK